MSLEDDATYFARRARKQRAMADTSDDLHAYCFHMRIADELTRLHIDAVNRMGSIGAAGHDLPGRPPWGLPADILNPL